MRMTDDSMVKQTIRITVEEPTGVVRENWPVTRGIPFRKGELFDHHMVSLRNSKGELVPVQLKPLVFWEDRSIKWLLVDFQASLPAQANVDFVIEVNDSPMQSPVNKEVSLIAKDDTFVFDNGILRAEISVLDGFRILDQVILNGKTVLEGSSCNGFILRTSAGEDFLSRFGVITETRIEEAGPLRAVLYIAGDHRNKQSEKLFRYEARLTAYAGISWMDLEYTFINDHDEEFTDLQEVSFSLTPDLRAATTGMVGAYKHTYKFSEPFSIYQDQPCRYFFFSGSRIYDENGVHQEYEHPGEMLKKVAHGWLDLSDSEHGLTVCVFRMAMLAPKAINSTGQTIKVDLFPDRQEGLHFHQGMARTHRVMLYFHQGDGETAKANQMATCYENDLQAWAPGWFVESGIFEPLYPYKPKVQPDINIRLRDQFYSFYNSSLMLGFLNYGDSIQGHSGPRMNYTANNEYDLPFVMAMQFARTGERDYFEVLQASAWHMMDIDFIHHTTHAPLELGGVRIHGNQHVQYNCEAMPDYSIATSHMWSEGLLAYYYLTGHPTAFERAKSIGQCLLNMVEDGWAIPPYKVEWHSVRDSAWAIIALSGLYEITREQKWLDCICKIATAVMDLQNQDGSWDLFIGWYNGTKVPLQIGIGINGLIRYYQLTGDKRALQAITKAAEKLMNDTFPEGNMMYIDAPGYRWNYLSPVILEGLGFLWELTGDVKYLKFAESSFRSCMNEMSLNGTAIAYNWRYLLKYLYWLDQAGLINSPSLTEIRR